MVFVVEVAVVGLIADILVVVVGFCGGFVIMELVLVMVCGSFLTVMVSLTIMVVVIPVLRQYHLQVQT